MGFFGIWTLKVAWFPECNSSLIWNFNFKFQLNIVYGHGPSAIDCQICHVRNGSLAAIFGFSSFRPLT